MVAGGPSQATTQSAPSLVQEKMSVSKEHVLVQEQPTKIDTLFYLSIVFYYRTADARWRTQVNYIGASYDKALESFAGHTSQGDLRNYLSDNQKLEFQILKIEEGKVSLVKNLTAQASDQPVRKIKPTKNASLNAQIPPQAPSPANTATWNNVWASAVHETTGQQGGVTAG